MRELSSKLDSFELGKRVEIDSLVEENRELKIKNLQLLGELHRLRAHVNKCEGIAA